MHIGMVAFSDLFSDYRISREAMSLRQAGHRVTVVASAFRNERPAGWEELELLLIPVDRSRSLRLSYPVFWRRARRLLASAHPDVCHAHDLDALWPAAHVARDLRVPLVYDSHELWTEQSSLVHRAWVRWFWRLLERRLVGRAQRVITVSDSIAEELRERYRLDSVVVVRNLPRYQPPVPSNRIREALGLPPERPVVLYQGGFITDNGLAEQIRLSPTFGSAALVLLGDGPCEAGLRSLVDHLDLGDRVFFIPRVPFQELHAYTCSADLGLCLIKGTGRSFYYSLPNKLFEYMMAGLPVLASDFPDMRRVVDESGAGAVVDPEDGPAIARHVNQLLGDPARRQACRQAALRAARRYNWERESGRLLELYNGL